MRVDSPDTPVRKSLSLTADGRTLHISGALTSDTAVVEQLVCHRSDGPGQLTIDQEPGAEFAFAVDLIALREECGADAKVALSLTVRDRTWSTMGPSSLPRDSTRQLWRLGKFVSTDIGGASQLLDVDGVPALVSAIGGGNIVIEFGKGRTARATSRTVQLSLNRSRSHYTVRLEGCSNALTSVSLVVAGRESQSRTELTAPTITDMTSSAEFGQHRYELTGPIPLDRIGPAGENWDELHDIYFDVLLQGSDKPVRKYLYSPGALKRRAVRDVVLDGDDVAHLVLPYFAAGTHQLALRVENHDPANLRFMRRLLWAAWILTPLRPILGIWLIGEMPYKAQDNGFHFFRWLRKTQPRRRAFYVIDPQSPERANVEPFGNVLERGSRKHILYTVLASRFLGTHHAEYLFASRSRRMKRWSRGIRVSLRHGVMGTKNMTPLYGRRSRDFKTDLFLVSSAMEREMIVHDFGHRPGKVAITGLARFDELFAADVTLERTILIIPSWRDWLSREEDFARSQYLQRWTAFLQHPGFQQVLADNGLTARFILHPNMRRYASHFEAAGISVIGQGEQEVQHLLKSSAMMVTDYSSVGFDFSFLGRPVVYFQFDRDRFLGSLPSHLDLDAQLPGRVAFDEDHLVSLVRETVDAGMKVSPEHAERSRRFIDKVDRHNCERIFEAVRRAWKPTIPFARLRDSNTVGSLFLRFRRSRRYLPAMKALYRVARMLPTKNLVVFESSNGKQYGDSPRYLYERLLAREHNMDLAWINNTTVRLPDLDTAKIARFSPRYFLTLARARMWITNQNIPHYLKPARGTTYVQTWHGTPLKRMQHDVESDIGRDKGYLDRVTLATGFWDYLLSPSPFASTAFRSAFRYDGAIIEAGYPRNDLFHRDGAEREIDLVRQRIRLQDGRKMVLYAPTFRDGQTRGAATIDELELDLRLLRESLEQDHVVVLRFHSLIKNRIRIPAELQHFVIDATDYPDTQELLLAADVLITDYSSIMFDFASLGRPMIFFAYDLEHYRDELRGFYLDFDKEAPGPILTTTAEVLTALMELDGVAQKYGDMIASFAATYAPLDDGHASDRVLDVLFADSTGDRK